MAQIVSSFQSLLWNFLVIMSWRSVGLLVMADQSYQCTHKLPCKDATKALCHPTDFRRTWEQGRSQRVFVERCIVILGAMGGRPGQETIVVLLRSRRLHSQVAVTAVGGTGKDGLTALSKSWAESILASPSIQFLGPKDYQGHVLWKSSGAQPIRLLALHGESILSCYCCCGAYWYWMKWECIVILLMPRQTCVYHTG